jgi:hypothetical protein
VFFINSGVKNILPSDRDFLWDKSSITYEEYRSCPPWNCDVFTSTDFTSGCDNPTVSPLATTSP